MAPPGWTPKKLDQLGFVGRGRSRHRPRNDPALYGGPYPFFQTGDVREANLYLTKADQTYNEVGLAQSKLWEPGTLCITIAANIAETAILSVRGCFPDSVVGFIADSKEADVRFIKYLIDNIKLAMQSVSHGTTQDNLSLDKLLRFDLPVPRVEVQRKIAAVLSAYDDLIENNTRRIAILEEMARALYREWFVHFRFPGHENVKMVESELGMIPEGWEVTPLEPISDYINRGIAPKYDDEAPGLVINQRCIRDGRVNLEPARHQSKKVPAEKAIQLGDVLINSTGVGTLGRVAQVLREISACTVDSHVTIVRPSDSVDRDFFGLALLGLESHFENLGTGATGQTELSRSRVGDTEIVLPPVEMQCEFGDAVRPVRELTLRLEEMNSNLRSSRDLLLPKLISGEVDVSDLDIELPDAQEVEEAVEATGEEQSVPARPRTASSSPRRQEAKLTPPEEPDESIPLVSPNGRGELGGNIDDFETHEIMAAFRQAARGRGTMTRDELLKEVSIELGYKRLGSRIEERLRDHLRAAIRRKIIGADGDEVWPETPDMATYERDELVDFLTSVMPKRREMERDDVIRALANHLGFTRVTDTVEEPIKSAINGAIRRGILGYDGSIIWRGE